MKKEKDNKSSQDRVEISLVKKLFDLIEERKITSVAGIACLERITGEDFKSTKDFRQKMKNFLDKLYYKGADLRKARKSSGMEQHELADWLEVSKHRLIQMENNNKPLSEDAIAFIKVQGFKITVPYKKKLARGHQSTSTRTPKSKKNIPAQTPMITQAEIAEFEKKWHEKKNPKCLECQKDCKQSIHAEVLSCPQFKKNIKGESDEKIQTRKKNLN